MDSVGLWELVKLFLAALLASILTHWLTHRRFIQGRWWDRKADRYENIVGSLVSMIHSLDSWIRAQEPDEREMGEEVIKEYYEVRDQVERIVTEGDYIISERASAALSELVEVLKQEPEGPIVSAWSWWNYLKDYRSAVESCLEVMRAEAKSDLRVRWWSL